MIEAPVGVQGESGCNGAPFVRFSQEDQLLKRLEEVERFGAKIAAELLKGRPSQGAPSRELLELELDELKIDRDTLQNKLALLLKDAPSSKSTTHHSREVTASCGRDLDARISDSLSSAALDQPGSSTTLGRGATASVGRDLDARVNESMSSAAPDQSSSSTTQGSITITAGNGVRDSDDRDHENSSGRDRCEQATTGRLTGDDFEYALDARTVVVVDTNRRLYNAAPAPSSTFNFAPSRAGYDAGVGERVSAGGGGGGGRNVSGVLRSVAVVEPGGGSGGGSRSGGGGFRVSKWQCRPTSDVSAQWMARSDTSQRPWSSAPFTPDTGIVATGIVRGRCDSNVNTNSAPTTMPLKRPSLNGQGFHEPKRFSNGVQTLNFSEGGVNQACGEQGFDEPQHFSSGVRSTIFSEGGVRRGWQGERRDGHGGQRVQKGPFRAPVAPFSGLDTPSGVFNEDCYLASPVSYPPPRPSHHRGYGYSEQRDYHHTHSEAQRDTQSETQRDTRSETQSETQKYETQQCETQRERPSLRRDMTREEPFLKRKTFRISKDIGEERDMYREEPFSTRKTFRIAREKDGEKEEEHFSKTRWTHAPAPAHWSGSGGVDNGNGRRGSPREFAIHTVPVALAVDAPSDRMAGDGHLYYEHNRQGRAGPHGEMPRNYFSSNTDHVQLLAERGGRRYDLGATVTPPPYR